MHLMVAIVGDEDAGRVTEALAERGYASTRISTASGFLKMSNTTLLIGVENEQVEEVLGIIKASCHPRARPTPPLPSERPLGFPPAPPAEKKTVRVGGAVVFVVEVKRCERL
ncbi:MAG: cyclic-di-AMP receptor [Anaerolineales bacterium]|nr:MAG: cyclic-di-AMP receptor [Anaerolineales bacterium]